VARYLACEDIVRLILDGTVIKTRLDRKATNISVLAAIGVRRDGQKVLLSIINMGGESKAAWGMFLGDLDARGLKQLKRLKELETENQRLKRVVADLSLDKVILSEAAQGNF
jgi:transposase-like protein